ncbi:C-C motif chemokine 25 [Ictidomys tridecemlineatus]|uniref:C-C motif chemokine 25 n=1 Tax=Ictidomys tridecemlineatus TaxID=43179 RepID=UPI000B53C7F0|nr:C-C motif chemokine 25 [Ictidomys tridecemlineatus]XP_040146462.1 C-C motif chemokine 25 [Ictidomys tridecemlineatus]XP_040146463.1 C-C motif chemokine 25 [Ictidomys tridecemlineatus]
MNPWILASLAACFLGAWVPPIHTQGSFEDCCLGYYPKPKLAVLRRASFYRIQEVSGSCNLFAIVFYFRQPGKMVCGNPRDIRVRKAMRLVSQRSDNRLTIQDSQAGRKKSRRPSSRPKYLSSNNSSSSSSSSSSSKRNASLI